MPCSDYGRESEESARAFALLKKENAQLEAMLCEIVGSLMGLNVPLPATVATWWIEHEAKDRDRLKAMRAQKDHAKARLRRQIEEAQAELKALEG
jgi:hypothetical protein